jgi:hypothetical protein
MKIGRADFGPGQILKHVYTVHHSECMRRCHCQNYHFYDVYTVHRGRETFSIVLPLKSTKTITMHAHSLPSAQKAQRLLLLVNTTCTLVCEAPKPAAGGRLCPSLLTHCSLFAPSQAASSPTLPLSRAFPPQKEMRMRGAMSLPEISFEIIPFESHCSCAFPLSSQFLYR